MKLKLIFTVVELELIFECSRRSAYRLRKAILEKFDLTGEDILTRVHVASYMNLTLGKFDKMFIKSLKHNNKRKKYRTS